MVRAAPNDQDSRNKDGDEAECSAIFGHGEPINGDDDFGIQCWWEHIMPSDSEYHS